MILILAEYKNFYSGLFEHSAAAFLEYLAWVENASGIHGRFDRAH